MGVQIPLGAQIISDYDLLLLQEKIKAAFLVENRKRIRAEEQADILVQKKANSQLAPLTLVQKIFIAIYAVFWLATFPVSILAFIIAASKIKSHLEILLPIYAAVAWPFLIIERFRSWK